VTREEITKEGSGRSTLPDLKIEERGVEDRIKEWRQSVEVKKHKEMNISFPAFRKEYRPTDILMLA
jgi:hypothetical protein